MSASAACARAVVAELVASGVAEVVLAPGSRSAPLALAVHAEAVEGRLRLHVRTDERAAGFLALGLAKGSGLPVAVITTSGTAVGNLLPAAMEAHHARVPLLLVTADRPAELVGTGANQTTHQPGIFGVFVRGEEHVDAAGAPAMWKTGTATAVAVASGTMTGHPGPVHVNVALPEPLVALGEPSGPTVVPDAITPDAAAAGNARAERSAGRFSSEAVPAGVLELAAGPRTVVVCGDATPADGQAALAFAEAAGLPLLAEPSSWARGGRVALRCGRLLLATSLGDRVQRAVMFGHPTLSRPVNRLLTRPDVELIVVGTGAGLPNPGWAARQTAGAVTLAPAEDAADEQWLREWRAADAACGARVDSLLAGLDYVSGPSVAATVLAAAGRGIVALGNSMAIRDADLAPVPDVPQRVFANRGLSGIDGTLSTAVGVALASAEAATLLCGDLSFVHDANALAIGPGEPRPDLRIVVADDAGGAIFSTLEYGRREFAAGFERVFATPTGVNPAALAAGYGIPARTVAGLAELGRALAAPVHGIEVVVVGVDRASRAELAAALSACAVH